MRIECTLQREGGTVVEMPGRNYHFKPTEDDPRHIDDVTIEAHIERFLSIPESFRLARTPGAAAVEDTLPQQPGDDGGQEDLPPGSTGPISTSPQFPAIFHINGKDYALEAIASRAFMDSGLTFEDWNGLDDEHRATKIEIVLDALEAGEITIEAGTVPESTQTPPAEEADAELATLREQYKAMFGKYPPSNMKLETLKAKLAAGTE